MPRNISFFMTTDQVRNKTKDVTRRLGWSFLKGGEILNACVKCQGLKKGEKIDRICQIRVKSVRSEPLDAITDDDVRREGFPNMTTGEFIDFFCDGHKGPNGKRISDDHPVNRIEYEYI